MIFSSLIYHVNYEKNIYIIKKNYEYLNYLIFTQKDK